MENSIVILHEDVELFSELIEITASQIGLPESYVEKDYWVTKALGYLSSSIYVDDVVFKGGTSLSKAYRLIDRFSEDIDLAIFSAGKNGNKIKVFLKQIETVVSENLIPLIGNIRESKGSRFRKTIYEYPKSHSDQVIGQASSELLIEINSFTVPEPFESRVLQCLIADLLIEKKEYKLIEKYQLNSFSIKVLSVERTLVEKVLGMIKDSYSKDPVSQLSRRIRHLYDICLILKHKKYRQFIMSSDFHKLCEMCIKDEFIGKFDGSDYLAIPFNQAPLFEEIKTWKKSLNKVYREDFSLLVYGELPDFDEIIETILFVGDNFNQPNV